MTRLVLVSLSLSLLIACGDPDATFVESVTELTVVDSAGVEIIQAGDPGTAPESRLGEPLHRVGWSDRSLLFDEIRLGKFLPDGSVLVADGRSDWMYRLDDRLRLVDSLGGPGQGPGEFTDISSVAAISRDSLVVFDLPNNRITSLFGETVATRQMEADLPGVIRVPSGVMPDGRVFWGIFGIRPSLLREGPLEVAVLAGDPLGEAIDTVATVPFGEIVSIEGKLRSQPMGPRGFAAPTPEGFVWSANDRAEVRWFTDRGDLLRILRWNEDLEVLDDEFWDDFVDAQVSSSANGGGFPVPEDAIREAREQERPYLPETVPLFSWSWVGTDGSLWLQRWATPGSDRLEYLVVSPDGRCVRNLIPPLRFEFLDSRGGRVLGRELSELDVHSAVVYGMQPCPAS